MNKPHMTGKVSKHPINVSRAKEAKKRKRVKKLNSLLRDVKVPKI